MTSSTITATTPLGMHAVAAHMIDHDLPGPGAIEAPHGADATHIVVKTLEPGSWVDSIHIDTVDVVALRSPHGYERASWFGRLPDTGVRVEIRTVRRTAARLVSITGGVA